MAFEYVPVDRDQQFLLPPDVREWLPSTHLVWFVLDVVARVDTSRLHARHRRDGVGRRAYDPDMLLALLVYAYCTGQRSSRQIERLCEVDVAYRVICANSVPDHTTIARIINEMHRHLCFGSFGFIYDETTVTNSMYKARDRNTIRTKDFSIVRFSLNIFLLSIINLLSIERVEIDSEGSVV